MSDEEGEFFDSLLLSGAIEVVSINPKTGEFLYNITPKMKDIIPELYDEHMNKIDSDLKALWQEGLLDINFFEESPTVYLTEKSFNNEATSKLPSDLLETLDEIKRIFSSKT